MNMKEKIKFETIKQVIDGDITRKEAMIKLNLSRQQIYRLSNVYINEGENGFIHKNKGRKSTRRIDNKIIKELEDLYLEEYFDYNFTAFYEEICNNYQISYDVILRSFFKDDIISPLAHKKTIKAYEEKMRKLEKKRDTDGVDKNSSDTKIELFESRIEQVEKAHIRRSNNLYSFGQEVQMDACVKLWFGNEASYLHLAVDRATKKVLAGWFEYEEITRGYYVLLFNIIINYGIPNKIKADNRSTFSANNAKNKDMMHFLTQFGKVCEELNIILETSSNPTFKPNVERENGTFKNRLISELRHMGITNINEANEYLNTVFIPKMNEKFSYKINDETSMMKLNNYSEDELNLIISEKYTRIFDNASAIKYNKKYYIPVNTETGEIVCFRRRTECTFILSYNGECWGKIDGHYYLLEELKERDSVMTKESDVNKKSKEKKHHKYIPPKDHPWRKNMMLKR